MVKERLLMVVSAVILDWILGDPTWLYHPVVAIGSLIGKVKKWILTHATTPSAQKLGGLLLVIVVSALTLLGVYGLIRFMSAIHPALGFLMKTLLCWQFLAARSLGNAARAVQRPLKAGELECARGELSMIVGRETQHLSEEEIIKATVETVSENTTDGVIAPLIYMSLGGVLPLAFYKVINTLDSMVGYIDPPYTHLGFFSAKLDDLLNWIPARLSALLMIFGGGLLGYPWKEGFRIFFRDRHQHRSPNSGQTESACAGLLGIQLGGRASYCGHVHEKPTLGEAKCSPGIDHIDDSIKLMYATEILCMLLILIIGCTF